MTYQNIFSQKTNARGFSFAIIFISSTLEFSSAPKAEVSFTYDQNYRLASALYDKSVCITYQYDRNGNRTQQVTSVDGAPVAAQWGSGNWGCFLWSQ